MGEVQLRVLSGAMAGEVITVEGELVLGRGEGGVGDLGGDAELSRRHARIEKTQRGHLVIEDLGSTNGTQVNGDRISGAKVLATGDRIELGATELEVIDAQATVPHSPSGERTQAAVQAAPPPPAQAAPPPPATSSLDPERQPLSPRANRPPPDGPVHPSVDRKPWRLGRLLFFLVAALVIAAVVVVLVTTIGGK